MAEVIKYGYMTVEVDYDGTYYDETEDGWYNLSSLGDKSWDLVTVIYHSDVNRMFGFFKREIKNNNFEGIIDG